MIDKINKKNILIIIGIFFAVLMGLMVVFYINYKRNETFTVEADVKMVGDGYIIVEDKNGEEYSLKTEESYNVGDKVSFVIKNIEKDSYPKVGTVLKIDTVSKSVQFTITDSSTENEEKSEVADDGSNNENNTSEEQVVVEDEVVSYGNDADVVSYFENLNNSLEVYNQDKTIGESLKSGFVIVIDFLFYDGQIKGKTFDELSTKAKIKVLQLSFSIDEKIEKYFPGYKEQISTTGKKVYTNVKAKTMELYLDITTKVCESDPDTCSTAKEGLKDLKSSFSLTWDFVKDISGVGLSKLKAWYEVWKQA